MHSAGAMFQTIKQGSLSEKSHLGLPNPEFHLIIFLFRYFELYPYYVKASTKVETEYYIWDLSSVMTALGGNLGLLLGYSILTMIMSLGGVLRVAWTKSRKVLGRIKNEN